MHNGLVIVIGWISRRRNDQGTNGTESSSEVGRYLLSCYGACLADAGGIGDSLSMMKLSYLDWIAGRVIMMVVMSLLWLRVSVSYNISISLWGVVILQICPLLTGQIIALASHATRSTTSKSVLIILCLLVRVLLDLLLVRLVLCIWLLLFVCDLDLLWVH